MTRRLIGLYMLALVALALTLWAAWAAVGARALYVLIHPDRPAPSVAELGQLGDVFGGANALFAALAGVAVFWAAVLQRRSLSHAEAALREERASTRRQQFDASFFQLLAMCREAGGPMTDNLHASLVRTLGDAYLRGTVVPHLVNASEGEWIRECEFSTASMEELLREKAGQLAKFSRCVNRVLTLLAMHGDELGKPTESFYKGVLVDQIDSSQAIMLAFYSLTSVNGGDTRQLARAATANIEPHSIRRMLQAGLDHQIAERGPVP